MLVHELDKSVPVTALDVLANGRLVLGHESGKVGSAEAAIITRAFEADAHASTIVGSAVSARDDLLGCGGRGRDG